MSPFNHKGPRPPHGKGFKPHGHNFHDRPFHNDGDRPFRKDHAEGGRPFHGHDDGEERPKRFDRGGDRPFRSKRFDRDGDRPFRGHNDGGRPFHKDYTEGERPFRGHGDGEERPKRFDRGGDRPFRSHGDRPFHKDHTEGERPFRDKRFDRDERQEKVFRPARPRPAIPHIDPEPPTDWSEESIITVSCARGLPVYAAQEVKALGLNPIEITDTTVTLHGTLRDAMMLNLWSRTATRVLWRVGRGWAKNLTELYDLVNRQPWEKYLPEDGYFTVNNATRQDSVRDTRLPSLCAKDAIADRFRATYGKRPNSGGEFTGAAVFVWWQDDRVELYLDTTGEPLSKRGYRLQPWKAPMQETLAAACIAATGWDPTTPFVAPMCGSGTPAIEAALVAINRAPGMLREHFCFMSLRNYAESGMAAEWDTLKERARSSERHEDLPEIIATDIAEEAVEAAKANANRVGVLDLIKFDVCDFSETRVPHGPGVIFMNPEYGERMGEASELVETYRRIGDFLKRHASAYLAAILTGNLDLARKIGLHSLKRLVLNNGPIDCRLLMFQM